MKKRVHGMTLLELLVGVVVIIILIALAGFQVKGLLQRAKVSAAKTTINGLALCLSMIKDDTCFYPVELSDTQSAEPPDGFSSRDWYGPYGQTLSLTDPWNNPYFYELNEGTIFGPGTYQKRTPPAWETVAFCAPCGKGTLIIDNPGITAGRMKLNGSEVVSPDEFKHTVPTIVKAINLSANNTLKIRLASNPSEHIEVKITSPFSKDTTFTLGSYGRDGEKDGTKYDADIEYGGF